MALTLRRRAAPESLLDSSPRGEECAASKIPDTAPWRCFEALSGIRSRSPSACHSSANSARHLRATLLPANYSEPPHELLLPAHQQDPATWQLELLSAIGAPASAQVFSARICPRLVVFWAIAPSSAEINERAGRLARISHIYGDALAGHALFDPPSTQALEPPSNPSKLDPPSPLSIVTCQQLSTPTNLPSPPSLEASLKPSTLHPSPPLPCAPFRESLSLHPPPPPALCLASLLPYDVAERIFLALSFADLISCAAVCKAWRCHVSSNKRGGEQQRALEWYRKAARMGHQGSQYRMGEAYYRGDGEWPRDEEEALAWLLRAARNAQADPVLGAAAAVSI
ncbi:unnamed protein product [Closterium sp. NIES-64]|nr:unnamed protein product [Closterium sp. NIES-64]